jgi:uroporphyrin-III C-methyltransferase/precorrin-2 dehydrogenase/sirohydrochlorin ferrochelatase
VSRRARSACSASEHENDRQESHRVCVPRAYGPRSTSGNRYALRVHRLYPLFAKLLGRVVLVVGAGAVAQRKIEELVSCGARVQIVAPAASERLMALARAKKVTWKRRGFQDSDVDGAWLAVAATKDAGVQKRVARAAETRRVLLVAVDDVANASAYSGSIVRRGDYTIAISSSGGTPALTRLLREVLEQALPEPSWVSHARRLRARWKREGTPMRSRFAELLDELGARAAAPPATSQRSRQQAAQAPKARPDSPAGGRRPRR